MQRSTLTALNAINQQFYTAISTQFSATRTDAWGGWQELWQKIPPQLRQSDLSILDIGCGNGRFAQFIAEKTLHFHYLGIDQSQELLELAQKNTLQGIEHGTLAFLNINIVQTMIDDSFIDRLNGRKFHLIVLFGVLHHIPSYSLRQKLLQTLTRALASDGLLILSCWRFDRNEALFSRKVSPDALGIDEGKLEEGDYFLTWKRGVYAVRYCHLTLPPEQARLVQGAGMTIVDRFSADGKTGRDNDYLILAAAQNI